MLNKHEMNTLASIADSIWFCTGGEFGYSEDAKTPNGLTRSQFKGYVSQLVQKGLICKDEEFGSVVLTGKGVEALAFTTYESDRDGIGKILSQFAVV